MKNLTKAMMVFGLFLGAMVMVAPVFGQSESAAPSTDTEKVVTTTSADATAPAAKHACKPGCEMACCAGKAKAMGSNAGSKKACTGAASKKSCSHAKSASVGGNVTGVSSNAGAKKSCDHSKSKACCASKKKGGSTSAK